MIIRCSTCGRQAIKGPADTKYTTTLDGAKRGFGSEVFCGHCAVELDEDGLFPEERNAANTSRRRREDSIL